MKLAGGLNWMGVLPVLLSGCSDLAPKPLDAPASFDGAAYSSEGDKVAHGLRISYALGCHGCHGGNLEGQKWDDDPKEYGVMWASNLTRAIPTMSDAQLQALLRRGKHPVRADLWVMPSQLFRHLSPADMAALIAYLRSIPASGDASPPPRPGPKARAEVASGSYKPAAQLIAENRDVLPADAGRQFAQGRYVTSMTCAECHGLRLEGQSAPEGSTPDLIVASAYSPGEFDRFITTGEAPGKRKIHELMVAVARSRFSHLTPTERGAVYAYLVARAKLPQ